MDVLVLVLISTLSAGATGVLVTHNMRQAKQPFPRRHQPVLYTRYLLPPPGQNFELYTRAKEVMDGMAADRFEAQHRLEESESALEDARAEQDRLKIENERLIDENKRLIAKIEIAQDIVRSFTHPGMKLQIQPERKSERSRIVTIL